MKANKWLIFRYMATLVFWSVVFFPAIFIPKRLQYNSLWQIFTRLFLFASKVRAHYRSKIDINRQGTVIYACNHKSLVDTYIIFRFLKKPFTLLFKKEMIRNPLFRFMAWKMALIPVDRGEALSQKKALDRAKYMLSKKYSLVIFPEGWHILDKGLGQFKRGIAKLAGDTGIKVVPLAIYGIDNTFIYDKKVVWKDAYLKAAPPIDIKDYKDEDEFLKDLRSKISDLYNELEAEVKKEKAS